MTGKARAKRGVIGMIVALTAMGVVLLVHSFATDGRPTLANLLILNGDFRGGLTYWQVWPDSSAASPFPNAADVSVDSDRWLTLTSTGSPVFLGQTLDIEETEIPSTVVIAAKLRTRIDDGSVDLYIECAHSGWSNDESRQYGYLGSGQSAPVTVTKEQWFEIKQVVRVPAQTDRLSVSLNLYGKATVDLQRIWIER